MEVSSQLKKRAKGYNTSWQNLVMADLIVLGYSENDSYAIAYCENMALAVQKNVAIRESILQSERFRELLKERKGILSRLATAKYGQNEEIELIGAEQTARELLKIATTMPEGSKERGEMFVRYADLIRKNDTQAGEDEDPVRIYLPMKCNQCPLKTAYDEQKNAKK